ncbi:MAG: AAA family ATPase [Acidimicrobiales bacterium]
MSSSRRRVFLPAPPDRHSVPRIDSRVHLGMPALPAGLIGRTKECRALDELLAAVREGQSRVLVARGDAGIGKSALLQHLIDTASGFTVVHSTGIESEMELPFAALHQLCSSLLHRLDTLPVPQRYAASTAFGLTAGTSPDRLLIGLAVLSLLSAAAEDGPLLCVVDDAHWLDRESAQVLAFVARRLLADHVGLVFATRQSNADLASFPELVVNKLHDSDAQTLLSAVLHVPLDERVRDRIVAETHGNPLALVEWPRGLTPSELAGGFGMSTVLPMTGQIEESFRRRVAELPEPARQFLTVAAAEPTGDPVVVWRAADALGLGVSVATPAVDAGLLDIGVRVRFRHPLVRSAAYASASLTDRQAAHRSLAEATDPEQDPDRRAWHRALGSPGPDEDVADALEHSADRARARGGFAAAAALLERSVALTIDPSRRGSRNLAAAAAHIEAGSYEIAGGLLASAEMTLLDDMGRAHLELLRARHKSAVGDYRDVPELYLRAAKLFDALDPGVAGNTYLDALAAATIAGTFARNVSIVDVARAAGVCPASAELTTHGRLIAGLASATAEGPAAAAPTLRLALDTTGTDTTLSEAFFRVNGYLMAAASALWDSHALHRLAATQVAAWRAAGAMTMLPWALHTLAHVLTVEGDLDSAASAIAESNQIIEATGANMLPWAAPNLAAWRGDGGARRAIDDLAASALVAGHAQTLGAAQWASAILHNSMGQYEQALTVAIEADRQPWEWGSQYHFPELIEAAARCGQPTIANATLERLAATAQASGSDWALGVLVRSRALVSTGLATEECYNAAIDHLTRSAIRPELARTHLLYGEWLRREGRRIDARLHLRSAHGMFTDMGINSFAERTRNELLATGETVRKRTPETFDALTPQEGHIARLAADGQTNQEIGAQLFISARTVEWHLRKVFTKLNITSRRQLSEALPRPASLSASS